ncbi:MAG TPA: cysteine--tRNA ligase [Candidatus Nanoarchaeia archaeon]|nr:cysteine--tRNA ligase [Candidatus Nanoarchaeia archaeon]
MQLHNTLTGKTEEFKPASGNTVRMYNCGPTVYNFAHIGNLRAYVLADTLKRSFKLAGFSTKQIINITDVGHLVGDGDVGADKVEEGAKREKKTVSDIIDFYTNAFYDDLKKLNIETKGTLFPKATEHIKEQIDLISELEKKGFTYKTSDGIYFDTNKFPNYGKLGNINLANLEEGARIGVNTEKKNPTDFALWKFSPVGEKREQEWESPWGVGFPGWHIECSAMSMKYLGETLDIHTGGIDHIPVHHNNEIAQSEAATGKQFSRFWLHNAFVTVDSGKMAKSAGNFIRLATLEEQRIHPLAYRYWLLTAHYRSPVMFSFEAVKAAQNALESLVRKIALAKSKESFFSNLFANPKEVKEKLKELLGKDLDTPAAIAFLHKTVDDMSAGKINTKAVNYFDEVLGLRLNDLVSYITSVPENIKKLSREREKARASNNWIEADRIRKEIENTGYFIEDSNTGPVITKSIVSFNP